MPMTITQTVTFTISNPVTMSPQAAPTAPVGSPESYQVVKSGGVGPFAWSATGLPPGLTINAATGLVSGTPTTTGSYTATVTLTDNGV